MQEILDGNENKRRDAIIAQSPLLKVFIEEDLEIGPDEWLRKLDEVFLEKRDKMISEVPAELMDKDLNIYFRRSKKDHIFNEETQDSTRLALIACFAWMGYEIGNEKEVDLFVEDVLDQIYQFNIVNEGIESDDFVREVMMLGAEWKKKKDETPLDDRDPLVSKTLLNDKRLKPYKNFIDKLNIQDKF
ncbi:MAG TPA: hypothetical protein VKC54_00920 [Patescibacteria group bacterium]|nr:hypothetical protein [Patescibacteria group bacterium]